MRKISLKLVETQVANLAVAINRRLPGRVKKSLLEACCKEKVPLARSYLEAIRRNLEAAERLKLPICQDTGLFIIFLHCGDKVHFISDGPEDLEEAIQNAIRKATRDGWLRPSVVDPLTRANTGDNTPSVVHFFLTPGDQLRLTVMAKGFGSENASSLAMLPPAAGWSGIEDFVIQSVKKSAINSCPPLFLGIGIGGTAEKACLLAKIALAEIDNVSPARSFFSTREQRLKRKINQLGIGAGGFGGRHTVLAIHIKSAPTHLAGLPVAVSFSCWAHRVGHLVL